MSVIPVLNMYVNSVSLSRPDVLKSGIGPTAEILSFASPKESIQRKGDPDSALFLRVLLLTRVFEGPSLALRKRAASCRSPVGPISPKAAMLGAE
jgi:hypothetical protein